MTCTAYFIHINLNKAIFSQWTDLNSRCYELCYLLTHEVMEVWVKTIHWTVNTHSHILLSHFVNECSHTSWHQMCSTYWDTLAYVTHIATVLVCCMAEAQFIQHLPAIHVASPFVAVKIRPINAAHINRKHCFPSYSRAFAYYVSACMSDAHNKFWIKNQIIIMFILFHFCLWDQHNEAWILCFWRDHLKCT